MVDIRSNTINITVSSSGCSCPTGDVCANSSGQCPSGSFPDNSFPGCCVPCNQLVPQTINFNPSETTVVRIYVNHCNLKFGYPSNNCSGNSCCQPPTNSSGKSFYPGEIVISGNVTDSNGHPICDLPIKWEVQNDMQYVAFAFDEFVLINMTAVSVEVVVWTPTPSETTKTDSNGNFLIDIPVAVVPYSSNYSNPSIPSLGCINAVNNPLNVTFLVNISVINPVNGNPILTQLLQQEVVVYAYDCSFCDCIQECGIIDGPSC